MRAYIRPVHRNGDGPLIGLSLCRTNGPCLVDEDIVEHFPADATGREIRIEAAGMGYTDVRWGTVLT